LFEHGQYLLPAGDLATQARSQAARLVRFLSWAANPYIKRLNVAFCLITEKLSELSERIVNNPHVAALEIPLPALDERRQFITARLGAGSAAENLGEMSSEGLAQNSAGLSLVNLNVLLSPGTGRALDRSRFRKLKKTMIERQCQGLVEFVEPPHKLDLLVGAPQAKARLEQDAAWIAAGRLETAPMGYLFCGPVGTGKTFFAECYAGSVGIPCLKLRNFRSKYVGETEGNIEQVLTVLRSLGPVVVMVDEADASLGDRQTEGDSGTSGRVFSMIASQMGDTRYRGQIIWILMTSRPDLLPIDLKRQGRCEVHIPLFPPQDAAEISAMFRAMAKKNKVPLAEDAIPEVSPERQLSGADLESILLASRRMALLAGREQVTRGDLEMAIEAFIPSAQSLEKELQEIAAVLECTDRSFLPPVWRDKIAPPGARAHLQERLVALRQLIED
jgi:AAA+ superfamily predicted ATPase